MAPRCRFSGRNRHGTDAHLALGLTARSGGAGTGTGTGAHELGLECAPIGGSGRAAARLLDILLADPAPGAYVDLLPLQRHSAQITIYGWRTGTWNGSRERDLGSRRCRRHLATDLFELVDAALDVALPIRPRDPTGDGPSWCLAGLGWPAGSAQGMFLTRVLAHVHRLTAALLDHASRRAGG
jgi:hypothetical protein